MGEWQHGILGCFGNLGVCIITYFCPCFTFGKNAQALGDSCCCFALLFFIPIVNLVLHVQQRRRIRERRDIDGGCCSDTLYTLFCFCCALIQESQEVSYMSDGGMVMDMSRE